MKEILMPRFDPEMKSGKVVEWLKKEGDKVEKGEPVVRIDTEKVSLDVESPESGILSKIIVLPPAEVPVGTALGTILLSGEAPLKAGGTDDRQQTAVQKNSSPQVSESTAAESTKQKEISEQGSEGELGRASPSARRVARDLGVDIKQVHGSGPQGRITKEDVEKYHSSMLGPLNLADVTKDAARLEEVGRPSERSIAVAEEEPKLAGKIQTKKLDAMRLTIGERMTKSWREIPHVPLFAEVKLSEAEKFKAGMEKLLGKKVSLTAIVTKALASSLRSFPDLNSRFEQAGEVVEYEDVDISIAVALESGLITPVVRQANKKTASEISVEIEELASKARSGKLLPADVRGGTTTVSNLGGYGVDYFVPIINPPQVTILGVGRTRQDFTGSSFCTLALVFDHRVTDGARAALLLQKIKDFIESPYLLQMA